MKLKKKILISGIVIIILITGLFLSDALAGPSLWSTDSLNKGLVGYWPLDSYDRDNTPYGNHANINLGEGQYATTSLLEGWEKTSLSTSAAIVIPHHDVISFDNTDSFSISVWARIDETEDQNVDYTANHHSILWKGSYSNSYGLGLSGGDGDNPTLYVGVRHSVGSYTRSFTGEFGQLYHVVGVFDSVNQQISLYIDGDLKSQGGYNTSVDFSNTNNWGSLSDGTSYGIGGNFGGAIRGFIDEPRIYNRILSEDEITLLYESYQPKLSTTSINKGLMAHYTFDNFGEYTENLITSITAHGSSLVDTGQYFYGYPVYKNTVTNPDVSNNFGFRQITNKNLNQSGSKKLTLSFWVKVLTLPGIMQGYARVYYTDGSSQNHSWSYDPNPFNNSSYLNNWTKVSATVSLNESKTPDYMSNFYVYKDYATEGEMDICCVQVEQKSYATPFVDGVREDSAKDNGGYYSHALLDINTPKWVEEDLHKGVYEFFKGEQKRIKLPDPYLGTKTISFWAKVKEGEHTSSERVPFLAYNDGIITGSGDTRQILLCMESDKFRMHGWGSLDPIASSNINDGQWHHLVWHMNHHESDANQRLMDMWVDGVKEVEDFSYSQGSFGPVADSYWWVGYNSRSYSPYLRDAGIFIDDIRFYDHKLSDDEVDSLFIKGKAGSSVAISTGSLNKGLVLDMPLTSKYTKDETVGSEIMADITPYGNDGQNYGASIGENGTSFATTGEYIRVLDDSILRPYNDEITFSLWLNPTAWATSENILTNGVVRIYHRGDWAGDKVYFLYRKDEYDATGNSAWAYYAGVSTVTQLETDSWYHIVGVRDGDNLKIFLNGEKERDLDALENQTPYTSYSVVDIGKYNGQVSDVKIYNRALSAEEVKLLYDKGR